MPIDVYMPQLSPTMTEGRIAKWTKNKGDKVSAGDIIAEVETDKATMEVEATDDGIIHAILGEAGSDIPVGAPIAILKEDGETVAKDYAPVSKAVAAPVEEKAPAAAPVPMPAAAPVPVAVPVVAAPVVTQTSAGGHIKASPLARRIAHMKGVALSAIAGTGARGRIVAADVAKKRPSMGGTATAISRQADTAEALTPMRKAIAARLTQSKQTVPHFYLQKSAKMDDLLKLRQQLNAHAKEQGSATKLTINDFFLKASANALADFPEANASWADDRVVKYGNVDISVAVAIEGGLITPIVFNADQKPLTQISGEVKALVGQAKAGTLKPEQYTGGSFSLSNLGMFGIETFSAIVNPPQAAILAVGSTDDVVVKTADGFGTEKRTNLTMSVDHRAIDGALGAELLGRIVYYLENPVLLVS